MTETERAIAAYNSGILNQTIRIYPKGKRSARTVQTARGTQIRLYMAGRIWQRGATVDEARDWVN